MSYFIKHSQNSVCTDYVDDSTLSDAETVLYYYGHRYYSPELGRWGSRDPIEESGGLNVYGFVGNMPIVFVDYLGYAPKCCTFRELGLCAKAENDCIKKAEEAYNKSIADAVKTFDDAIKLFRESTNRNLASVKEMYEIGKIKCDSMKDVGDKELCRIANEQWYEKNQSLLNGVFNAQKALADATKAGLIAGAKAERSADKRVCRETAMATCSNY